MQSLAIEFGIISIDPTFKDMEKLKNTIGRDRCNLYAVSVDMNELTINQAYWINDYSISIHVSRGNIDEELLPKLYRAFPGIRYTYSYISSGSGSGVYYVGYDLNNIVVNYNTNSDDTNILSEEFKQYIFDTVMSSISSHY